MIPRLRSLPVVVPLLIAAALLGGVHSAAAPPVTLTATTLSLTAAGAPVATVAAGTVVTLTASVVTPLNATVHPGQVRFCDASAAHCTDAHLLGTAQLTAAGTATLRFVPGPGLHSYAAYFNGTTLYQSSNSAASALA
ncbi:MAG: Ig-like domain repeat protein, partial [Acidobacteriota bacterium]